MLYSIAFSAPPLDVIRFITIEQYGGVSDYLRYKLTLDTMRQGTTFMFYGEQLVIAKRNCCLIDDLMSPDSFLQHRLGLFLLVHVIYDGILPCRINQLNFRVTHKKACRAALTAHS